MPLPKTILVDCDGCLTDGTLTIDHTGEKLFKKFHTRDVRAIRELIFNGYAVIIVTADDWEGTGHFAAKVGAELQVIRDKRELQHHGPYIAVGDDAWDIQMLRRAALAFAPHDAYAGVKLLPNVNVLQTPGGQGVMAEVLDFLLKGDH